MTMGWRGDWPQRVPRPKLYKMTPEALAELRARADRFIARSALLRELGVVVRIARGRLYVERDKEDDGCEVIARITPLSGTVLLLESEGPRGGFREDARGSVAVVLKALERDRFDTIHGLGMFAPRRGAGAPSVQATLREKLGIPFAVLAEPREWYAMKRTPVLVEMDETRGRALVRFESLGPFGRFHGTGLYAKIEGKWGFDEVPPRASASIASAEAWLQKERK